MPEKSLDNAVLLSCPVDVARVPAHGRGDPDRGCSLSFHHRSISCDVASLGLRRPSYSTAPVDQRRVASLAVLNILLFRLARLTSSPPDRLGDRGLGSTSSDFSERNITRSPVSPRPAMRSEWSTYPLLIAVPAGAPVICQRSDERRFSRQHLLAPPPYEFHGLCMVRIDRASQSPEAGE